MTGWFQAPESFSPTMRHSVSFEPPAGNGTTIRTGFCGQAGVWAWAATGNDNSNAAARRKTLFIMGVSSPYVSANAR